MSESNQKAADYLDIAVNVLKNLPTYRQTPSVIRDNGSASACCLALASIECALDELKKQGSGV